MAKKRRNTRAQRGSPRTGTSPTPHAAAAGSGGAADGGANPAAGEPGADLAERLQALREEVGRARADAAARSRSGGGDRPRRGLLLAAGVFVVLVAAGVAIGLAVSSSGRSHPRPAPVAAYLTAHAAAGTEVGVIGPTAGLIPPGLHPVALSVANLRTADTLPYALGPDPITKAGTTVSTFVESHATLVATDPGRATLWALHPTALTPPASVAPTTVPATTVPPTTVPPATTRPAATPPAATPPAATPPAAGTTPSASNVVVRSGDSFWSIARSVEATRLGATPTDAQVAPYWAQLVAANSSHLPVPGNPNLIFPGQTLILPAG